MQNAICESILIIYNPRGFDFVPQCSRGKEATDSLAISFEVNHFSTMTPLVRPEGFSAQYHDAPGTSQKKNQVPAADTFMMRVLAGPPICYSS